jgi:hypothetical protein
MPKSGRIAKFQVKSLEGETLAEGVPEKPVKIRDDLSLLLRQDKAFKTVTIEPKRP